MLPQDQVHPGGHHQQRQGVSRDDDDVVSDLCNDIFRCGSYPGLYTDVARYVDWIIRMTNLLENEIE